MKIIKVSNFNNESVSDELIAENVFQGYVKVMADALNEEYSWDKSLDYFRIVDDDYELYTFKP